MAKTQPFASDLAHDPVSGWCSGVRRCPSPNFDARPPGSTVDLLVIHGISLPAGCYGASFIEDLFQNRLDAAAHADFASIAELRVSAHFLISRGGAVVQFVGTGNRAWHAGVSWFEGRERCNDFSVGIELEGCDHEPYADAQYGPLLALTWLLMRDFPGITPSRIVGHSDIAPGRKTDPGPYFDWRRYRASLAAAAASGQEVGH